eukprot:4497913-Amphidinium_carterae.1
MAGILRKFPDVKTEETPRNQQALYADGSNILRLDQIGRVHSLKTFKTSRSEESKVKNDDND